MAYALIKRGSSRDGLTVIAKGDPPFCITEKQLALWGLSVGQELDETQYRRIKDLKQQDDCMTKALSFLALREHTALELSQKLSARGFPKELVRQTISVLQQDGSLSEKRYAEVLVRSRQRRNPEGKSLLVQRLQAKGVSHEDACEAVEEAFEECGDAYLKQAYEEARRATGDREKLMMRLLRKGFTYQDIKRMES